MTPECIAYVCIFPSDVWDYTSAGTHLLPPLFPRFLCEFIYFTSLRISPWTVFVHVPPIGEPYSIGQLASTVSKIVQQLLEQKKNMAKLVPDSARHVHSLEASA